jgi:hypothetical protein
MSHDDKRQLLSSQEQHGTSHDASAVPASYHLGPGIVDLNPARDSVVYPHDCVLC